MVFQESAWYQEVRGSNPGKGQNFSKKISISIIWIWMVTAYGQHHLWYDGEKAHTFTKLVIMTDEDDQK